MSSSFDEELRRALKRVDAPDGFTERVMRKIPDGRSHSRYWFGAIAAGLALLFTYGGIEQNRREHRMQAEQAQREVVFALALTADKLDHALNRANIRLQRSAPDVTIESGRGARERGRL